MKSQQLHLTPALRFNQSGSVLVQFALLMGVLVAILGILDIGYMYYAKRELQRIADQAAVEAVQNISAGKCMEAGEASITNNWPLLGITRNKDAELVSCGNWNPDQKKAAPHSSPEYFGTGELNAAKVIVQGTSLILLPGPWSHIVTARAIAKRDEPLAQFSVGARLLDVGCNQQLAPLVQLLKVVGVDDPCVSVGNYEGLVGAKISASGLLKTLGLPLDTNLSVADINNLLTAEKISLGKLLDTALTLGGHSELLDLNAKLLSLLSAQLGIDALNLEIPLGSGPNGPGIFAGIHAPDGTLASAMDVQLNVLDIVTAAVGVGTSGRAISIPSLKVDVPFITGKLLEVKAGIIEPPSISIGSVGATAYNAQVRLYINVDTSGALGGLLELLGTQIKLPIFVDVARAKGTIEDITCKVPGQNSTARIRVDPSIVQACIGKTIGAPFSTRTPICDSIQNETLVSVLGLIKVNNKIYADVLSDGPYQSPDMMAGDTWSTPYNNLNLGTTLANLVNELLRLLGNLLGAPSDSSWTPAQNKQAAQDMANYYFGIGNNAMPPLPTIRLGLINGKPGAYDTNALVGLLSKDIDRSGQGCFLGIPFLCWQTNDWQKWGNNVGRVDGGGLIERYIGGGTCFSITNIDVTKFNQCMRDELAKELLKAPSNKPKNFLQVLLAPLLEVLKGILNPLGKFLAGPILNELLGINLGVTDVNVNAISCGNAQLVY